MIYWDTNPGVGGARSCVVYVVRPTDARRGAMTHRLAAAGWTPLAWAWDDRFDADKPLDMQCGVVDAIAASVVTATPIIVLDPPASSDALVKVLALTVADRGPHQPHGGSLDPHPNPT